MKLAIMQPYFFPYIGYFQLLAAVDAFIVYDNIQYTKKGWINRNRMLRDGKDATFTLPLKKDSDYLDVREREIASDFNRDKLLGQLVGAYRKAPYFKEGLPLLETVIRYQDNNLFGFLLHSIKETCDSLGIGTEIKISSEIAIDHDLKGQDKVLALCKAIGADAYINPIGGVELYSRGDFKASGIDIKFIKSKPVEYPQFDAPFVPWLSIIDVFMFNPVDRVKALTAGGYELT